MTTSESDVETNQTEATTQQSSDYYGMIQLIHYYVAVYYTWMIWLLHIIFIATTAGITDDVMMTTESDAEMNKAEATWQSSVHHGIILQYVLLLFTLLAAV